MKKVEFDKMSLEELIEWSESDASEEASGGIWNEWKYEVKKKAKKHFWNMDFCQLTQFYRDHPHDDIPAWSDEWYTAIQGSWPFSDIYPRLEAIEKSLDVILKKYGSADAGISINQLIRLKGGHSV